MSTPKCVVAMIAGAAAAAATGLMPVSTSFAESGYLCDYYSTYCNGPQEPYIDTNWGNNQTGYGVCSRIWSYYSGGYHSFGRVCTATSSEITAYDEACLGANTQSHGEAEHYYNYNYVLGGYQWFEGRCV
jgi:hypothetical protein